MTTIRRIALTPGEPAGIGADICLMLMREPPACELLLFADENLLRERAQALGLRFKATAFDARRPPRAGQISLLHIATARPAIPGQLMPANAEYVLRTLRAATHACLDNTCDALVTGPVHKGIINEAGIAFTGHTEYLAGLTRTELPVMMLAAPGLRVALVTTHLPLKEVPAAITDTRLESVLRILDHDLRARFGIARPRVLVCGLNPHAGEDGHLGLEDKAIIEPVIRRLRDQGLDLSGPLPADTAFTPPRLAEADAVLCMYHDQGLPVLKHMGFGRAVNITLGLPIIRTSVDHGTALELAGTGRADDGSLRVAIDCALNMVAAELD